MKLDTDLQQYLPAWYREIVDYQELCLSEGKEFEGLAAAMNAVANNFFFQEMDESAISEWEEIFGIIPDLPAETTNFRRARLLNRISLRPPFTLGFLYQKLDELIGVDQWKVRIDYENYTLYVESSARNQEYALEVSYTIGKIKPAHIVFVNTPYTESSLELSETIALFGSVYNYRLGGWGLGVSPFATEEERGIIKMASVPSIQPKMLSNVASFVSSDIASVRLNGTVSLTDITKTTENNIATIEYTVKPTDVSQINKAEVLDSSGNVLTVSTVYVPITESVVMKHKIPVNEGGTNNA